MVVSRDGRESRVVDHLLAVDTRTEVITGSTRLKAGTAQKLVLNSFSTATTRTGSRRWTW